MPKITEMEEYWNNIKTLNKEEEKEFRKIMVQEFYEDIIKHKEEFINERNTKINSGM